MSIVYIDGPVGVGYSPQIEGQSLNDEISAADNLEALRAFFSWNSNELKKDIYLGGESYGGVYVPYLAKAILQHNEYRNYPFINLKGIIVGNGLTSWKHDTMVSLMKIAFPFGLIDYDTNERLKEANCNFADKGSPPLT